MRKAYAIVLAGLGAVTLAGAAAAASRDTHVMNVPLPDGSTARIEYVGNVAPKVTVAPAPMSVGFPAFGMFDRSMADMQRQIDAMMRQANEMATHPAVGVPGMNVVAYGNAPAGAQSVTVVSTSNGAKACTRTTEVTSQGPGKPPKVVTNVSGDCGPAAAPAPMQAKPTA
jgi:hypothetical protein